MKKIRPRSAAPPRIFLLMRHEDVSGVSGTGGVAEGIEWSDGSASLRWGGRYPVVSFWSGGVSEVIAVHGHDGASEIAYLDDPEHGGTGEARE